MELQRAKELLQVLSDGVNPLTGEVLPADDSANQADIVRAIYTVLQEIDRKKMSKPKNLPENAGKAWTKEDDERLCQMFDSGFTKKEMCESFKRTESGLASRLVRLGKINNRDEFRFSVR